MGEWLETIIQLRLRFMAMARDIMAELTFMTAEISPSACGRLTIQVDMPFESSRYRV